jgi:hypothetical protein
MVHWVRTVVDGYHDVMDNKGGLFTHFMLLTLTDNLMYLQLHTVQSI